MKRPRTRTDIPAAVITDQDAPVARVVPLGATEVRVGKAVLGYDHDPHRRLGFWTRNAQRIAEVETLRAWRATQTVEHGLLFDVPDEAFLRAILPELRLEAGLPRRPLHRANAITWATEFLPALFDQHGLD